MAAQKGKDKKIVKKAKATVAVVNKPVRPGSIKATYFQALQKGGTVAQVLARIQAAKPKGKVNEHRVRAFAGWAVKRGLVVATDNGFKPGKAELVFTGKDK